ncbi:hypothetical protein BOX15_Mlig028717g2, partial [Macrostomum lignano]
CTCKFQDCLFMPRRKLSTSMGLLSCFGARRVPSKRRPIDPSMIGDPVDFRHTGHMGCGAAADLDMSSSGADSSRFGGISSPAAADGNNPTRDGGVGGGSGGGPSSGRYIDLAALRERNFDLGQLSAHFSGPSVGGARQASRGPALPKPSAGGPLDITNCFLTGSGSGVGGGRGDGDCINSSGSDAGGLDLSGLQDQ